MFLLVEVKPTSLIKSISFYRNSCNGLTKSGVSLLWSALCFLCFILKNVSDYDARNTDFKLISSHKVAGRLGLIISQNFNIWSTEVGQKSSHFNPKSNFFYLRETPTFNWVDSFVSGEDCWLWSIQISLLLMLSLWMCSFWFCQRSYSSTESATHK